MRPEISITVAVLTYNPDPEKLAATMRSVLAQQGVKLELVVADDGSARPDFDTPAQVCQAADFQNVKYVKNPVNRGTVYNTLSAVENSTGTYIKLISPGDLLAGPDVLCRWAEEMERTKSDLSFAEAVYYGLDGDRIVPVCTRANPQDVSCYRRNNTELGRFRYLICDDLFLGAATLCRRETLLPYLQRIAGKVVYAEDNVYRLMQYHRVPVCYFPENAVIYETGLGVSTSGSDVWRKRLKDDWDACSALLLADTGSDPLDSKLKLALGNTGKVKKHLLLPGLALWKIRKKLFSRKTPTQLPEAFMESVLQQK